MGHLPVIADVFRCTLNWQNVGLRAANVMHVGAPGKTVDDVFTVLDANVTAGMFEGIRSTAVVSSVEIIKLDGTSSTAKFNTGSPARWGGNATTGEFSVVEAIVLSMKTGLRGQANRGRLFLPFIAETAADNGKITSGAASTMLTEWSEFSEDLTAAGIPIVIASYKHAVAHVVTQMYVDRVLHVQKRRAKQLGPG